MLKKLTAGFVQVKNGSLSIKWSDDHESLFSLDWLLERAFTASAREVAKRRFYPKPVLWGSDQLQDKIPSFNFTQVITWYEMFLALIVNDITINEKRAKYYS